MPTKPTDDVFHLVKSLRQDEIRYFKKLAKVNLNNNKPRYLRIFDAMLKQDIYDEVALHKIGGLKNDAQNFSRIKNYLYYAILRSLTGKDLDDSSNILIHKLLIQSEHLFARGLFEQSLKHAAKARELAIQTENFQKLIEILELILAVHQALDCHPNESVYRTARGYEQERNYCLAALQCESELQRLSHRMSYLTAEIDIPRSHADLRDMQELMRHRLLHSEESALPYRSRSTFYTLWCIYLTQLQDCERLQSVCRRMAAMHENYREPSRVDPGAYIASLDTLLAALCKCGLFDVFKEMIDRLRCCPVVKPVDRIRREFTVHLHTLQFSNMTGDTRAGMAIVREIRSRMRLHSRILAASRMQDLHFALAVYCFSREAYLEANNFLDLALADNSRSINRQGLLASAKVLHLIVHIELEHWDYLAYAVRNTLRFFRQRQPKFRFEWQLVKTISRALLSPSSEGLGVELPGLRAQLDALLEDRFERNALERFDILAWIDSKINGRSFAELVKMRSMPSSETRETTETTSEVPLATAQPRSEPASQ